MDRLHIAVVEGWHSEADETLAASIHKSLVVNHLLALRRNDDLYYGRDYAVTTYENGKFVESRVYIKFDEVSGTHVLGLGLATKDTKIK